jgi:hypothetical protein
LELYKKAGNKEITYSKAMLEEPGEFLANIEKEWKGTSKAFWRIGMYQWGRKGLGWQ